MKKITITMFDNDDINIDYQGVTNLDDLGCAIHALVRVIYKDDQPCSLESAIIVSRGLACGLYAAKKDVPKEITTIKKFVDAFDSTYGDAMREEAKSLGGVIVEEEENE